MKALENFLNPGSIALIGAAHTGLKLGGVVLENLLRFKGKLFPVNPKYGEMMGVKTYRSAREIPEPFDLCVVIRPAHEVPDILREIAGKTNSAIIVSAGFAEAGDPALQEELKETARRERIRILGPNCMGIYNPAASLDTLFLPHGRLERPPAGNLGVTTQSGAVLSGIFGALAREKVGVSKALHYGNAADIDESDIYEYLAGDDSTGVVISYIESVRDGRRFVKKAQAVMRKKPLLILKAGKGSSGEAAAYSHTGRLAGSYQVFKSVMAQFGMEEALSFEDLIDQAKALSFEPRTKGNRVLIITNGGGCGVLASDECTRQGLSTAPLPADKRQELKNIFPPFFGIGNPFDLTAQSKDEDYGAVLGALGDYYDGFLVIALTGVIGVTEKLAGILEGFRARSGRKQRPKPVVFMTGEDVVGLHLIEAAAARKIPSYPTPERSVRALRKLLGNGAA